MSTPALSNSTEATSSTGTPRLIIEFPPAAVADDVSLISAITKLVNQVFIEAEAGIWNHGFVRTSDAEVADFIRKGQLAVALDKTHQGLGLGREIFKFVEEYCLSLGCDTLGLDILVPTSYAHPLKTRMEAWYRRLGFQLVRLADFADDYPALAPLLSGPVDYRVFEKKLK